MKLRLILAILLFATPAWAGTNVNDDDTGTHVTSSSTSTEGTGIDISAGQISFDSTEIADTTWGSGSAFTWTIDSGTTDQTVLFNSAGAITLTQGAISGGSATRTGFAFNNSISGSTNNTNIIGATFTPTTTVSASGTASGLVVTATVNNASGTINTATGVQGTCNRASGAGVLGTCYGLFGDDGSASAGSITNNFSAGFDGPLSIESTTSSDGLQFTSLVGTTADTNLYRSAANILTTDDQFTSTFTTSLGWVAVDGTDNTAGNSQCTNACVFGVLNATGTAVTGIVSCDDAAADTAVCAGAN